MRRTFLIALLTLMGLCVPRETYAQRVLNPADTIPAHSLTLRTNAVGWGMLCANISVEYDFSPRWALALPIYYSGMNYFTSDQKFRIFSVVPQVRYRFGHQNNFYVGLHAGISYFNFAFGGNWRYQDHDAENPAWGGGVNLGYRVPFRNGSRWGLEFGISAGVWRATYDKFENYGNGPKRFNALKTTWFGIDGVDICVTYTFPINARKP